MTTISWNNGVDADWTTGAAWIGNIAPTTGDDAVIDVAGAYTVTITAAQAVTVHSATLNDAGATLAVAGKLTLTGTTPSLQLQAGEVLLSGTIAGGTVELGANALSASGAASVTGVLDAAGGTITVANGATLTVGNGASLDGSEQLLGPGTLASAGTLTVGAGGILVDDGLTWSNGGTLAVGGRILLGYPSHTGTDTIINPMAGVIDLVSDTGSIDTYGPGDGTISNAGLLAKTGGTATSDIGAALNNSGTLSAISGTTLELDGGGTFGAKNTIAGTGAVVVNGGTFTLAGSTAVVAGALVLTGGTVQITTNQVLTLSGAADWGAGAQIDGPGTLLTTGATSFTTTPYMDGSLVWNNGGIVSDGAQLDTDYTSGAGTMTINNEAGAAFDLTADGNAIYVGSTTDFNNLGTLAKTGGSSAGISDITVDIANTGTLAANIGTLELGGGGTFGTTNVITGAGVVEVGGGTFTLANSTATITGPLTLAGGVVQIATLDTLTLAGANTWETGTQIDGPGTLATTGTTSFATEPNLDGNLVWNNTGIVKASARLDTDNTSGAGTMTINNEPGGVFDLTYDGAAIYVGSVTNFNNSGTLAKTSGTGTSSFADAIANTGTLTASTGTLELDDGGTLGGKIGATGSGQLVFGGGTFTVAAATATVTGPLAITGGLVQIDPGKTLTLTGANTWGSNTQIDGAGTLATSGTTSFASEPNLDGSLVWNNTGTVSAAARIDTDYTPGSPTSTGAMTINNKAAGVIDFTTDDGIYVGSTTTLNNAGTLAKTGGTGLSAVFAAVVNTGTLAASTGTLELDGGGTLGGTVVQTATGAVQFGGGVFAFSGTVAAGGTVTFDNNATLAVGAVSGTISSASVLSAAVTIAAGKILTLSGATTWDAGTQIDGPGTLLTTGATTFLTMPNQDGSLVWNNSGIVSAGAQLDTDYTPGAPTSTGTVTIDNLAGGAFDLTADGPAIYVSGLTTVFTNAGVLAKTIGTGTSSIGAAIAIANTGTLTAKTGTLELDGGGTFGATTVITGAGSVVFGGGTFKLTGSTATIAGALYLSGGVVQIDALKTLTLSGATTWDSGTQIDGPGTLLTSGATTFATSPNLDGSLVWDNSGVVNAGLQLDTDYTPGDPSSTGTVTINNQAGAGFDLTADGPAIYASGLPTVFNDAGVLAKTGGTGTSSFSALLNSTGTLGAIAGTLELDGGGTFGGTTTIIGQGVVINGGTFTVAGAAATVAGALTLSGGTVQIASTKILTLSGAANWGSGTQIDGAGTLLTTGATSFTTSPNLDGNLVWNNNGVVSAGVQLMTDYTPAGPASTGTVTINNLDHGGTFQLTADGAAIYIAGGATTVFNNAGVLTKTGGTNTSTFAAAIVNAYGGTITATTGTLELDAGGTLDGTVGGTGSGVVVLGNGASFVTTNDGSQADVADAGTKNGMRIVNGATWTDSGIITADGHIEIGNGTGTSALVVKALADLRFTSDDGGIVNGGSSTLTNAGEIAKTDGTGTSVIGMVFTNTGTVIADSGTLKLSFAVAGAGELWIDPAATLELASGAVAGVNTVDMNGLGATLRIDTNSNVAKPIVGLGAGSHIDLAAASLASVTAVMNGDTLAITAGASVLNFVSTTSLAGLIYTKTSDGGSGTVVALAVAPPPVVTPSATPPSASNATIATLGTAVGFNGNALMVNLSSDDDFPSGSTLALIGSTLFYTPGLVTEDLAAVDTLNYTVTDKITGAVAKVTQNVTLSDGPPPVFLPASTPTASNIVSATLGSAVAGPDRAGDVLSVKLISDTEFATGSTLVINSGGTLTYTPGLVTLAQVGEDPITYSIADTKTDAFTEVTQTVTLSNGSPPLVTQAAGPSANNNTKATLGTAAAGVPGDMLKVILNSDSDFATGSTLALNGLGTLIYTPGLVTAGVPTTDHLKYTVTDQRTGGATVVMQNVTLNDGPSPVVTLAATAPSASNNTKATLGTAAPGIALSGHALSVTLNSDPDFATGSTVVLNSGGTLIYTPGLVTAGTAISDKINYTVTDTVTDATITETQTVTLSNGPSPVVTLASAPSANNNTKATLGTAAPGIALSGHALTVTLNSDPDFPTGSTVVVNSGGTLIYTPGLITAGTAISDKISYTVADAVTGATIAETQTVTLSNGPSPVVTLAATTQSASDAAPATLGTATPGHGSDVLSVTLTSDSAFATGSTLALNGTALIYTPGLITAGTAVNDTLKYTVTDTVTGAVTNEIQAVTLVDSSPPVVILAAAPSASNAISATLGTAAPAAGTDALMVKLNSDSDFATGSAVVLNSGGTLIYTPGLVTAGTPISDKINYTVTDKATGAAITETQTVTLSNGPSPVVTFASNPPTATNASNALLGSAAGHGGDALSVTLTSDPDFATGSKLVLTGGNLIYTPGAITPAKAGSDSIGYTVKDTVTGAVTAETQAVLIFDSIVTLTAAPTTVTAAQEISMFITPNGALNSRDNLTGGPNDPNTLALSGPGVFDLNAPKVLANIQLATASEGQTAYVNGATNIASTTQTIFLRDGLSVDLSVGAGTPNAANPGPHVITIYGGSDGSVINLGTGSDTVVLGGVGEKVVGGGGTALVQATVAFAGAQVIGAAAGVTTLEITTGGTGTLNVNTTHATVKLDQKSVLTLSHAGFITAIGEVAGNTITAAAANQTLEGLGGGDTLVGFSGFGDIFTGLSAGLNGDTIKLFGGTDKIDLTDLLPSTVPGYSGSATQGILTLSDGTHHASITMLGDFVKTGFHVVTDGHSGSFITYT